MSMCRVFSCVVGRDCLLWPVHSLGKTLLAFILLHSVFQGQICLLPRCLLTSYFCIPVPYNEKDIFLVLKGLIFFIESFNFSFFSITDQGINLDYCDTEWFALETNRDHSGVFETASKYCTYSVVHVTGDGNKVQWCKEQYRIGTWNVRSMNQGKLEVVKQEMARVNINILGIGEFNSVN